MEVGKINKANIFLFTPLAAWGQRESVAQTFIPLRLTKRAVRMSRSKHQDMLLRPGSFFGSSRALLLALWLFSHYWKSSVGPGSKLELIFWTCSFVAFPLLRLRRPHHLPACSKTRDDQDHKDRQFCHPHLQDQGYHEDYENRKLYHGKNIQLSYIC